MSALTQLLHLEPSEKKRRGLFHTVSEIAQQPATWKSTFAIFEREQQRIRTFLERAGVCDSLERRPVVFLVGAGTSDYIGMAVEALLRRHWGCQVYVCPSTTLLTTMDDYIVSGQRYLWISFSRSGDSAEGVAVLQHACQRYPEIAQMVVTCNARARIIQAIEPATQSCCVVLDEAVNDRSLVMTSSFTNMVIMGQCLAHAWSLAEYSRMLEMLITNGKPLLQTASDLASDCERLHPSRVCFLGSGPLLAVARESALKVLEMTAGRLSTSAETVLGLRHGPMALLDEETLLVCSIPQENKASLYASDLLEEVRSKGIALRRIAIGPDCEAAKFADRNLVLDERVPDSYRPVLDVMLGQLLGLYCSLGQGLKPDAPSPGGVIQRVVQGLTIY